MNKFIKHFSILFISTLFWCSFTDAVTKLEKMFPGVGTVTYTTDNISEMLVSHRLLINWIDGGSDIVWSRSVDLSPLDNGAQPIDMLKHSQLVDLYYDGNKVSFILSGYEGLHCFLVAKNDEGIWKQEKEAFVTGVSGSPVNPLKYIKLQEIEKIVTESYSGEIKNYDLFTSKSETNNIRQDDVIITE